MYLCIRDQADGYSYSLRDEPIQGLENLLLPKEKHVEDCLGQSFKTAYSKNVDAVSQTQLIAWVGPGGHIRYILVGEEKGIPSKYRGGVFDGSINQISLLDQKAIIEKAKNQMRTDGTFHEPIFVSRLISMSLPKNYHLSLLLDNLDIQRTLNDNDTLPFGFEHRYFNILNQASRVYSQLRKPYILSYKS